MFGISLVLISPQSIAMNGNELFTQCTSPEGSVEIRECGSYIMGVMSGTTMMMVSLQILHPESNAYPMLFCVKSAEPTEHLIDVVVKFLRGQPGTRHYDAASQVLLAFSEAFPCH